MTGARHCQHVCTPLMCEGVLRIKLQLAIAPTLFLPNVMSSNSHIGASSSQFQAVFDAALNEYSRKTGKDIGSDPLTAKLQSCGSSSEVHGVLQEQAQIFDEFRNGGQKVMRKLEPTVDILLTLSNGGVLGNGIGLVSPRISIIHCGRILTYPEDFSARKCDLSWHWPPTRSPYSPRPLQLPPL